MNEEDIKAEVLSLVRAQHSGKKKPVVATEFAISSGNSRADLAILSNQFVGVEIKSKKDSLKRLSKQVLDYTNHFDRTILVLDGSHLVRYHRYNFPNVDLWTFDENNKLRLVKEGAHHNAPDQELYGLLTQAERRSAFRSPNFEGCSKRDIFFFYFRKKFRAQSEAFWNEVKSRKIRAADLRLLSRFIDERSEAKRLYEERTHEWEQWLEAQERLRY